MAVVKFDCKGFSQFEPNQVWFTRAGKSESQVKLNPKEFASHFPALPAETDGGLIYSEIGTFLAVDKTRNIAVIPGGQHYTEGAMPVGVNYSSEHIYNQFTPGRRNYAMVCGEFLPRIGYLSKGERFTTNGIMFDTDLITDESVDKTDIIATSKALHKQIFEDSFKDPKSATNKIYYGTLSATSNGRLVITQATTPPDATKAIGGIVCQVVKAYTNADGTLSFMFQVLNA